MAKEDQDVSSSPISADNPNTNTPGAPIAGASAAQDKAAARAEVYSSGDEMKGHADKLFTSYIKLKNSRSSVPSAQNALKHGFYSPVTLYPWESAAEFEDLHTGFKNEWQPDGRSEEDTVYDLARYAWIKQRVWKMSQLPLYTDPLAISLMKSGKTSWREILDHKATASESAEVALLAASALLSSHRNIALLLRNETSDTQTAAGKDAQSKKLELTHKIDGALDKLEKEVVPLIKKWQKVVDGDQEQFMQAYNPDFIDKQMRTLALIQTRFEKTLNHLIKTKEYKRFAASQKPLHQLPVSPPLAPQSVADEPPRDAPIDQDQAHPDATEVKNGNKE